MARTITWETKKEGQKKAKRHTNIRTKKKGRKLVPFVVGSYFTHNPFDVACMQIMRPNDNGRSRISITRQCNFCLYNRG